MKAFSEVLLSIAFNFLCYGLNFKEKNYEKTVFFKLLSIFAQIIK
jgi:hypothetical protein